MPIDLHTHSIRSDGTQSPAEVMSSARSAGLDVVALTDHDTTAGWGEAADAAAEVGIGLVRGIEISCAHEGISIHLLGYLQDPANPALLAEIQQARDSRRSRARRMVEALAEDLSLTYEDVLATAAPEASIGRPHIADALVTKGVVASRDEAFATLLHPRGPYYVSHYAPPPESVLRLLTAAGGVVVMAHPFAHRRGRVVGDEVIEGLADAGLAGLEVWHRDHDAAAIARGDALAARLGLLATGSSDYHGAGKLNRLGENTTSPAVLAQIVERASGTPMLPA